MNINKYPQQIQELYDDGERCLGKLYQLVCDWYVAEYCRRIAFSSRTKPDQEKISQALREVNQWLSALGTQRRIHEERKLKEIQKTLEFAVLEEDFKNNSVSDTKAAIKEALSLVKSIPLPQNSSVADNPDRLVTVPNTVFMITPMNSSQPENEDFCSTIRDVCRYFRKRAFRADDVPHNGQIHKVVFESIATSEWLIADLTGERPNVYYEVGIARALDKEPVLCCKNGTKIHVDLVGNNVIEYNTFSELKKRLQARLKGMCKAA
jgi:hypothetical protein